MFSECDNLETILIPSSVISIGEQVFAGCDNLENIKFEEGSQLRRIGNSAFKNCIKLTSIEIPLSVKTIDPYVFSSSSLTTVYYTGTEDEWNNINISEYGNDVSETINIYYFSETEPIEEGNYWHYDADGNPVVW